MKGRLGRKRVSHPLSPTHHSLLLIINMGIIIHGHHKHIICRIKVLDTHRPLKGKHDVDNDDDGGDDRG